MTENQIIDLLRTANKDLLWGAGIHLALDKGGDINELLSQLRSQYKDCPEIMASIFNSRIPDFLL